MDFFEFEGSEGDDLRIMVSRTSGSLYPRLEVWDPNGDKIIDMWYYDDISVDETLAVSGTYLLAISDHGQDYSGSYNIEIICFLSCTNPLSVLTISPSSGDYVTTQNFDLTLIVKAPGLSVVGGSATLDGKNIWNALMKCISKHKGSLVSGGQTFRCPSLSGGFLGAGAHTLSVTFDLSDVSSVSDAVNWEVLANTEH